MRQSFSLSSTRCFLYSLFGWIMLFFCAFIWLTWKNPGVINQVIIGFCAFISIDCVIISIYLMYHTAPVYIMNERGLIVRQAIFKPDYHYRVNWCDIENIYITKGKYSQLQLKIKDGAKHYFHTKERANYAKQKLKFNRTIEILALAPMVEGGRHKLYDALVEYWECYRE